MDSSRLKVEINHRNTGIAIHSKFKTSRQGMSKYNNMSRCPLLDTNPAFAYTRRKEWVVIFRVQVEPSVVGGLRSEVGG
jgi:hypothetical protein